MPEIETIKNELLPWVVRQSLTQVTILDAKIMARAVEFRVPVKIDIKLGKNWGKMG